jgi:hypothetical protein
MPEENCELDLIHFQTSFSNVCQCQSELIQPVMLLTYIQEVPGSNPVRNTACLD